MECILELLIVFIYLFVFLFRWKENIFNLKRLAKSFVKLG